MFIREIPYIPQKKFVRRFKCRSKQGRHFQTQMRMRVCTKLVMIMELKL
jgi:hypothetical protein